ncbi:uncharacterized protein MONOS_17609 [Monocercomonoides exilis]|uniref:uncharacterized protein n=1 Tax=Monocercomonoides exilis TaxID=2049356 RepID=UPI00355A7BAC|nr:hypothetical protein MONOS_17609 [Monocercomonoides exilis]
MVSEIFSELKQCNGDEQKPKILKMSLLHKRFEKMIIDEAKKKKRKNEKLLIDLDECHFTLCNGFSFEFLSICVPCLLKVVLNKVESKESRDEVEMAFLSLSNIEYEIKKNGKNQSLEDVIADDLHFAREATRELEELAERVDWSKREERERELKNIWKKESKNVVLKFLSSALSWLKGGSKTENEEEEEKKKKMVLKKKMAEKIEEEGIEDICFSFYGMFCREEDWMIATNWNSSK